MNKQEEEEFRKELRVMSCDNLKILQEIIKEVIREKV